jgi:hypothetical protein
MFFLCELAIEQRSCPSVLHGDFMQDLADSSEFLGHMPTNFADDDDLLDELGSDFDGFDTSIDKVRIAM